MRPAGRAGSAARARARGARGRDRDRGVRRRRVARGRRGIRPGRAGRTLRGADRPADDGGAAGLRKRGPRRPAGAPGGRLDGAPSRASGCRLLPRRHHERGRDGRDADADERARAQGTAVRARRRAHRRSRSAGAGCRRSARRCRGEPAAAGPRRPGRASLDGYDCVDADDEPGCARARDRAGADRAGGGARALPLGRAGADRGARARDARDLRDRALRRGRDACTARCAPPARSRTSSRAPSRRGRHQLPRPRDPVRDRDRHRAVLRPRPQTTPACPGRVPATSSRRSRC